MAISDQQFLDWLDSDTGFRCILAEIGVKSGGSEITRYLSSRDYVTGALDTPAHTPYESSLTGGITFNEQISLNGGSIGLTFGDIEVMNTDGEYDAWFEDVWKNRPITVLIGDVRWPRADFRVVFSGVVDDIGSKSSRRINFKLRDKLQRLNTPIIETTLGGTTQNKDRLLPVLLGEVFNATPLLVDPADHVYQYHAGAASGVIEVRDDGVPIAVTDDPATGKFTLTASPSGTITVSAQGAKPVESLGPELALNGTFGTDTSSWTPSACTLSIVSGKLRLTNTGAGSAGYAQQFMPTVIGRTYKIAANMTNGTSTCYINVGNIAPYLVGMTSNMTSATFVATTSTTRVLLRLNSSTAGTYADFDNVSLKEVYQAGDYTNTIANLTKLLATAYGTADNRLAFSEIDLDNFAAFNAANPQPVGAFLPDRANVLETCQRLAASVGAQVIMSRQGLLRILQLTLPAAGTPVLVTADDMVEKSLRIVDRVPVVAGIKLGYCKNWTVQEKLETGIKEDSAALFANEWLTVTKTDAATAANYKLDIAPDQQDTFLLRAVDADSEATRRLNLQKVQRTIYEYTGFANALMLELGQPLTLQHERYGLSAGKTGVVVNLKPDWMKGRVTVQVMI